MVSKVTVTLFFASLAFLKTNGCVTKELIQKFLSVDLDKNGVITPEEHKNVCLFALISDEDCIDLFESFDLNSDGQATCQGK